jgi:hypothetical protein
MLYCIICFFVEAEVAQPVVQRKKVQNSRKPIVLEEIAAMGAIHSSVHFLDASCPVGVCRYKSAHFCVCFLGLVLAAFYAFVEDGLYELHPILCSLE